VPVHAVKVCRWSGHRAPLIHGLGTGWKLVSPLPQRKNPWYPLARRLGGPQVVWISWKRNKSLARNPVIIA
jgi:hypothetical protein